MFFLFANLENITPFVNYLEKTMISEFENCLYYLNSGTNKIWWYNGEVVKFKNQNSQTIIETIIDNPEITIRDLSEQLSINKSAIQKQIKNLQDKDYLQRIGGTKGHWIVTLQHTN